jgi:hypothetical protein
MKVPIFYSWQSDLPNNKNRGLIETALNKAKDNILSGNQNVTEIEIISDSRGENGTPDLVSSIFNKIDSCDIFIADISIINANTNTRLSPNPNVLLELGYASHVVGWNKSICIFNSEYAKVEELPFDIRTRKPITFNTSASTTEAKKLLANNLAQSIDGIVNNILIDKNEYTISKRTIDLAMQAILLDFCRLLYEEHEKYNYNKLLMASQDELKQLILNRELLGFWLYRNISNDIKDFTDYFNDNLEMYFLSEKEKRILAKLVFALKSYERLLRNDSILTPVGEEKLLIIIDAHKSSPINVKGSYILAKPHGDDEAIVQAGGQFIDLYTTKLLHIYHMTNDLSSIFSQAIIHIVDIVNEWIRCSGNYFIANIKSKRD